MYGYEYEVYVVQRVYINRLFSSAFVQVSTLLVEWMLLFSLIMLISRANDTVNNVKTRAVITNPFFIFFSLFGMNVSLLLNEREKKM